MKNALFLCGVGNGEGIRLALTVNRTSPRWQRIVLLDDDKLEELRAALRADDMLSFYESLEG